MTYDYSRSPELALASQCFIVVSDIQERLMAAIPERRPLIEQAVQLLRAATLFEVPVLGTEQYPQGLGTTVPEIAEFLPDPPSKLRFSCVEALQIPPAGERHDGRFRAVIVGIETHVCVQQTAFDLQALGYEVILPVDTLASQRKTDRDVALRRMETAGMTLTTAQALAFEWCETASHPAFRQLSRLVQGKD